MRENYLKKLLIALFLIIGAYSLSFAQISEGGTPKSFDLANDKSDIDKIVLTAPNVKQLKYEDEFYDKNGEAMRIGVPISVDVNPETAGTWTELPNGDRIWRLEIESKGAKYIGVHYNSFRIPKNGKLFLYSADKSRLIGAFTSKNNPKNVEFANEMIPGDKVIIEYNERATAPNTKRISQNILDLNISHIIYFYKGLSTSEEEKASEECEVNINCSPVGDDWQDEKRGVARIVMNGYLCSGTLINNTSQDCTPYFLTAYHCGGSQTASEHYQWEFYFGYEASTCTATTGTYQYSIIGCSVKTTSDIDGGSDLQLVKLNSTPTEIQNPYYNGWDKSSTGSPSGCSIHHPAGDIKKISTYTSTLTASSPNMGGSQMQTNSAWKVAWTANDNGHGVTEGGSSGSPIFNPNGLIVGTLSGGSSACDAQTSPDYYGRFNFHWTNGNLATYLDPTGTDATTLTGTNAPCGGVEADFIGNPTTVVVGNTVTFTDNSTGTITSRSWSFSGGTPSSSTATNPTITYNTIGTYNVTLNINSGEDTEIKNGYINVVDVGSSSNFTLDFEASNDFDITFDPWTVNDVDQTITYGIDDGTGTSTSIDFLNSGEKIAFIAFNPASCSPVQTDPAPNGGERFGACFASIPSEGTTNNDWLISPKIQLGTNSSFKLWVKSHTDQYGLERYKIGVSTTTNNPSAFTMISTGTYEEAPTTWTKNTYSLAYYDNQEVYVSVNCISEDAFIFMIDDLEILTTISVPNNIGNNSIRIFPNPTTGIVNIDGIDKFIEIQILDIQGKLVKSINNYTNIINVSELQKGNYIVKIITDRNVITKKLTLIK
jgi:PKD repeat protein